MTDEAVCKLAKYFTGPIVAYHSVCLSMPTSSPHQIASRAFFDVREALGIRGYANEEEAAALLRPLATAERPPE